MLVLNIVTHGFQAALFSAFAALTPPGGETSEIERILDQADPQGAPHGYCSASSEFSPTGRQKALVSVSPREPEVCVRIKLGGVADPDVPDCWKVARDLGCDVVVDLN